MVAFCNIQFISQQGVVVLMFDWSIWLENSQLELNWFYSEFLKIKSWNSQVIRRLYSEITHREMSSFEELDKLIRENYVPRKQL